MANPIEVRLEVLKMAKDLCTEKFYADTQYLRDLMNELKDDDSFREYFETTAGELPKFPTSQDLLAKAMELYTFITIKE